MIEIGGVKRVRTSERIIDLGLLRLATLLVLTFLITVHEAAVVLRVTKGTLAVFPGVIIDVSVVNLLIAFYQLSHLLRVNFF